jgi:hypothetical protein
MKGTRVDDLSSPILGTIGEDLESVENGQLAVAILENGKSILAMAVENLKGGQRVIVWYEDGRVLMMSVELFLHK